MAMALILLASACGGGSDSAELEALREEVESLRATTTVAPTTTTVAPRTTVRRTTTTTVAPTTTVRRTTTTAVPTTTTHDWNYFGPYGIYLDSQDTALGVMACTDVGFKWINVLQKMAIMFSDATDGGWFTVGATSRSIGLALMPGGDGYALFRDVMMCEAAASGLFGSIGMSVAQWHDDCAKLIGDTSESTVTGCLGSMARVSEEMALLVTKLDKTVEWMTKTVDPSVFDFR